MAGMSHVYVTAHGNWNAGVWAGEIAQIGLRYAWWNSTQDPGEVLPARDVGTVDQEFAIRQDANYNITSTFKLPSSISDTIASTNSILDDIIVDFSLFTAATVPLLGTNFGWNSYKIAPIEFGTGKYLAPSSVWTRKSRQQGTVLTHLPPEVAIACSFRTPVVGRKGRGRMFIPALATTTNADDGTVNGSSATVLANAAQALVRNLANKPGIDLGNSGMVVGSSNSATWIVPLQVRIGNHFDAQRRRQHQVAETYTSLNV